MLFMIVEEVAMANYALMVERFKRHGRMLPEGVGYVASWMEIGGLRCFQVMEAPDRAALDPWIERWSDLVSFEVSEVLTSKEYWARASVSAG